MFIFPLNAYSITIHLLCECVSGQLLCWLSSFDAGLGTRIQNCNKNLQVLQLISDFGNAFTRRKVLKVRKVIHNKKRPIRVLLRQPSSFFSPAAMSLHGITQLAPWIHNSLCGCTVWLPFHLVQVLVLSSFGTSPGHFPLLVRVEFETLETPLFVNALLH